MTQAAQENGGKGKVKGAGKEPEATEALPGDEEYNELVLDRASLKFEPFTEKDKAKPTIANYTGCFVEGFINGVAKYTMTDEQTGEIRDCMAYIIELTRVKDAKGTPLMVYDRGSDTPREAKEGEEVRLNQTAILRQNIPEEVANHPTKRLKVRITPTVLEPHPTKPKLKLWRFAIGTMGIADRPASKVDHIALMLRSAEKAAELAAKGE